MAQEFNWLESRPQQYNNSKTINAILSGMNDRIKVSYPELIQKVFDVDTAEGKWLDAIAERVGASRYVSFPVDITSERFGFDNADWYNFAQPAGGTFYESGEGGGASLTDEALRTYIRYKCFANTSSCSLKDLNQALQRLFSGRGTCYATVENDMELTLVFNFSLYESEKSLITNRYFPVPAGYGLNIVENPD